jgi:hypothetical protein
LTIVKFREILNAIFPSEKNLLSVGTELALYQARQQKEVENAYCQRQHKINQIKNKGECHENKNPLVGRNFLDDIYWIPPTASLFLFGLGYNDR